MTEASRVQKMLNEQNEWIDRLKSQVMRLEFDVVGYRTRNKQLEAALRQIIQEDALTGKTVFVGDFSKIARKALEGKDDPQTDL
jgi:hypothetical protein